MSMKETVSKQLLIRANKTNESKVWLRDIRPELFHSYQRQPM